MQTLTCRCARSQLLRWRMSRSSLRRLAVGLPLDAPRPTRPANCTAMVSSEAEDVCSDRSARVRTASVLSTRTAYELRVSTEFQASRQLSNSLSTRSSRTRGISDLMRRKSLLQWRDFLRWSSSTLELSGSADIIALSAVSSSAAFAAVPLSNCRVSRALPNLGSSLNTTRAAVSISRTTS